MVSGGSRWLRFLKPVHFETQLLPLILKFAKMSINQGFVSKNSVLLFLLLPIGLSLPSGF